MSAPWWLPEYASPEYQETLRVAKYGLDHPSAFGRWASKELTTITWNEWVVKNWLDRHRLEYVHNWRPKFDAPEGFFRKVISVEFDFYIPSRAAAIEVNPLFHYKTGHPVTRRVMLSDMDKQRIARENGVNLIEVIAYAKPEDFAREVVEKLSPLVM